MAAAASSEARDADAMFAPASSEARDAAAMFAPAEARDAGAMAAAASSPTRYADPRGRGRPVRWTKCWREGCTLRMANGYDHPGTCNVVVAAKRGVKARSTFALDALPSDVLMHLIGALPAHALLALECCSSRWRSTLRSSEAILWSKQLHALLDDNVRGLEGLVLDRRAVYRALRGTLEVRNVGFANSRAAAEPRG
jgi:hypothetical protein